MGQMYVTLDNGARVTLEQMLAISHLIKEHGEGSYWHPNDCGCCATVHPGGDKTRGYIVNSDGDVFYEEVGCE